MQTTLGVLLKGKGFDVICASPNDTVFDAILKMVEHHIGGLLVMDGDSIMGMFTERDLLTKVVAKGVDPKTVKISDVMSRTVVCVSPETTSEEAMAIMTNKRVRHLPVMKDTKLIGLISIGDVTKWLSPSHVRQAQEIEQLVHYIHGGYSN